VTAQGVITTLAGNAYACSFSGDGGPASAATLCNVAVPTGDAAGNIYFADNYRIRKIGPDGIINTIAGNGVSGSSGDGGPALSASIGIVKQIAVFGSRVWFVDSSAYKIRSVDLNSGLIQGYGTGSSASAGNGGPFSAASLGYPEGIAFDNAGNLYLSDSGANQVRKVDAVTGIITAFAGYVAGGVSCCAPVGDGGPALGAQLSDPEQIFYYNGGLYIADHNNNRVRRVDLATGIISTVAGNGEIAHTGGDADGQSALLAAVSPRFIALDPAGNLFLADYKLRRVDTSGIIATIGNNSGGSSFGYDDILSTQTYIGLMGFGFDPVANRLVIADYNSRLRQIFYTPPTVTTLTVSPNPAASASVVTLQATVSPATATGSFRFYNDTPAPAFLGSVPVSNGAASFSWTLPTQNTASYQVRAVYGGDAADNLSLATVAENTIRTASTVAVTSNPNPSTGGQYVTLTATVSPSSATGYAYLMLGQSFLGSAALSNGVATFSQSFGGGSYALTVQYQGDGWNLPSTSATLTQVVGAPTTTTLSATPTSSVYGSPVTLTATVSPATVPGSVSFRIGNLQLASVNVVNGQAQLSLNSLQGGSNSLFAVFNSADPNYGASTSPAVVVTVAKAASTVTLTSWPNPALTTDTITLVATVAAAPGVPNGTVQFLDGATVLGSVSLTGGTAYFPTSTLAAGTAHSLTAVYSGDPNYLGSTSPAVSQVVRFATTLAFSMDKAAPLAGQPLTLIATVTPSLATGTVQFTEDGVSLGTAPLSGGIANLTLSSPAMGLHSFTIAYSGDANYGSSLAAGSANIIMPVTGTLTSSPNPSAYGQAVTLLFTVSPSSAMGQVQFKKNGQNLGSAYVNNGTASITLSDPSLPWGLTIGVNSLTAAFGGYNGYGNWTASTTQTVTTAPSTVTLTSSANPSAAGQSITLTATVSPSQVNGSMQFLDGSTVLGTVQLAFGAASFTTSTLIAGTVHSLTAVYSGDATTAGSTSAVLMQTVNKVTSTVALGSSLNPAPYGQGVTFTATVTPSLATGTVQFLDGATALGSATLASGTATLAVSTLSPGGHSITAVYSGDATTVPGTSAPVAQTVNKIASGVTLQSALNPAQIFQDVFFAAGVTPASATGTVQFLDGAAVLGTVTLSNGSAGLVVSTLAVGAHSITAVFSGDANTAAGTSAAVSQTVTKATTATYINSAGGTIVFGQPAVVAAVVNQTVTKLFTATGTLQLLDGGKPMATVPLIGSPTTFSLPNLAVGTHVFTVVYSGDDKNAPSTSAAPETLIVTKATASVTVSSALNPSVSGTPVQFSATVAPAGATGTVQFLDGATAIGTAVLSGGTAVIGAPLAAGSHSITAVYTGDANCNGATSAALTQIVNKSNTSLTLASSVNPSTVAQAVTFTAAVSPASATGTVQFLDGAKALGTATVSSGVASIAISTLAAGAHSITAVYSGDANSAGSASPALAQTVNKAASSVSLSSSPNPSVTGQSVTLKATVSPASATGTVQFLDGANALGTATVKSGSATLAVSTLAAGTHAITAIYSGDAATAGSTSAALTQTVKLPVPAAPTKLTAAAVSSSQINLSWTASASSGVTYNVYAAATSGFTPSAANRVAAGLAGTTWSNTGVPPATTRYYVVTAQNAGGESASSNQASAATTAAISCHVNYSVTSQWNGGFGTAITIKNTGTAPINGWNLTWTWAANQQITQAWNSNYTQAGQNASLTNATWNPTIAAGATLSGMGFNASFSGTNAAPSAFYVNGTLCQ